MEPTYKTPFRHYLSKFRLSNVSLREYLPHVDIYVASSSIPPPRIRPIFSIFRLPRSLSIKVPDSLTRLKIPASLLRPNISLNIKMPLARSPASLGLLGLHPHLNFHLPSKLSPNMPTSFNTAHLAHMPNLYIPMLLIFLLIFINRFSRRVRRTGSWTFLRTEFDDENDNHPPSPPSQMRIWYARAYSPPPSQVPTQADLTGRRVAFNTVAHRNPTRPTCPVPSALRFRSSDLDSDDEEARNRHAAPKSVQYTSSEQQSRKTQMDLFQNNYLKFVKSDELETQDERKPMDEMDLDGPEPMEVDMDAGIAVQEKLQRLSVDENDPSGKAPPVTDQPLDPWVQKALDDMNLIPRTASPSSDDDESSQTVNPRQASTNDDESSWCPAASMFIPKPLDHKVQKALENMRPFPDEKAASKYPVRENMRASSNDKPDSNPEPVSLNTETQQGEAIPAAPTIDPPQPKAQEPWPTKKFGKRRRLSDVQRKSQESTKKSDSKVRKHTDRKNPLKKKAKRLGSIPGAILVKKGKDVDGKGEC